MTSSNSDGVFHGSGEHFVATPLAAGPWFPGAQAGSAVAGLFAHVFQAHSQKRLVRLTVDIHRVVPLGSLEVRMTRQDQSSTIDRLEATMRVGEKTVASGLALFLDADDSRATALPVARVPNKSSSSSRLPPPAAPPVETPRLQAPHGRWKMFYDALELYSTRAASEVGNRTAWCKMTTPLVAGTPTTGAVVAAVVADLPIGTSGVASAGVAAINPDISLYLHRHPVGEWIVMEGSGWSEPDGIAMSEASLWDDHGHVGTAAHCRLVRTVRRREGREG